MICPLCGKLNSPSNETCYYCNFQTFVEKKEDISKFWYENGMEYYSKKQIDDAINCFKHAIRAKPTNDDALNAIGVCFLKNKEYSHALDSFNKALYQNVNNDKAKINKEILLSKYSKYIEGQDYSLSEEPKIESKHQATNVTEENWKSIEEKGLEYLMECYLDNSYKQDSLEFYYIRRELRKKGIEVSFDKVNDFFNDTITGGIIADRYMTFVQSLEQRIQNNKDPCQVFVESFWGGKTNRNTLNLQFFIRYLEQKKGKTILKSDIIGRLTILYEKNLIENDPIKKDQIRDIINKYYRGKDEKFKTNLLNICDSLLEELTKTDLEDIRYSLYSKIDEYVQIKKKTVNIEKNLEINHHLNLLTDAIELIDDLEKIQKILQKKEIDVSNISILSELSDINSTKLKKEIAIEYSSLLEEIRVNFDLSSPPKEKIYSYIVQWHLKPRCLTSKYPLKFVIVTLLSELGITVNIREIDKYLNENIENIQEDYELEQFERNLGVLKEDNMRLDYESLSDGFQFEEFLGKLFEYWGFEVVLTPKTGDQGADLIIIKNGVKGVVQAKFYSGSVGNGAIQEVVAAKNYYNAEKAMVVTNSSFTHSAIELAEANDVELWDGQKLHEVFKEYTK